jgi:SAM-dependent methyltransferase
MGILFPGPSPLGPPLPSAFGPLSTAFHDALQGTADVAEIDWYAARLPLGQGPVLEGLCGSGRTLVPLAQRGFHVHGVDQSAAMLAACEARLALAGLAATLFRQDITELNLPFRYAAAYVSAGSFQLLAAPLAARAALARIHAHLVPPGLLLLDLVIPEAGMHPPGAPLVEIRAVKLADGARITLRTETLVQPDARRLDVESRFEKRAAAGPIEREDARHARLWYEEADIAALLADSGFVDISIEAGPRPDAGERRFAACARAA